MTGWFLYVPGVVIVLVGTACLRWLGRLQVRVNDHAERLARLEGAADQRRTDRG